MFVVFLLFFICFPFALLKLLKLQVSYIELIILFLMLLLLSSITMLPDLENYELSYRLLRDNGEPGFWAIESFFSSMNFSFYQFYMVCHVACLMIVYLSVKLMSFDGAKCLLLYAFYPFLLDVIQIRNAMFMALALLAFAICTRCKKRFVEFFVWFAFIGVASTIHYSAYAYLPAVLFWNTKTPTLKLPIVMFFLTSVLILIDGSSLMVFMQQVFAFLDTNDSKYDDYMEKRTSLGGFLMMAKSLLMIYIVWFAQKIKCDLAINEDNDCTLNCPCEEIINKSYGFLLYSSLFWPLYVISATFGRLMQNQLLLVYIVFILLFKFGLSYENSTDKRAKEIFLFRIALIFVVMMYLHSKWLWIDFWDYILVCLVDNLEFLFVFKGC